MLHQVIFIQGKTHIIEDSQKLILINFLSIEDKIANKIL